MTVGHPIRARIFAIPASLVAIASPPAGGQTPGDRPPEVGSLQIPGAMLGSWGQTIKDENYSERDDPADTLEALIGTRQDFYIYHIDSETNWTQFQELVARASLTDLKIYAAMNPPHLAHAQSRWFDTNGDGSAGDPPPEYDCGRRGHGRHAWQCQREYIYHWLRAWERAARDLSLLSAAYPDTLVGFVINDFMLYVEQPAFPTCINGLCLSKSEIARIHDACHQHPNSTLGFYPALTFPDVGSFISPGYVLGTNYGVRMSETDQITLQFDVPLLPDPYAAKLSFFHSASSTDDDMIQSIWVAKDGEEPIEVWWSSLHDKDRPSVEYAAHWFDLDPGHNRIELRLNAPQPSYNDGCGNIVTSGCGGSGDWWRIWGVELEYWAWWDDGPAHFVFPLTPEFETVADPDAYCPQGTCLGAWFDLFGTLCNDDCRCHVDGDCTPLLPDDPAEGRLAKRLVCAPNDAYLIQDVIDGIVAYVTSTALHGATDALNPNTHYARLLRQTKTDLGDDQLIVLHTAFPGVDEDTHEVNEADTDVLVHRIYTAAGVADGSGAYRFPLPMFFMDPSDRRGIFAETPSGETGLLLSNWPNDQAILPGWYQRWVHQPPGGTTVGVVVEMWDNRDEGSNWGMLTKSVGGGGLPVPYEVDPYADGVAHEYVPSDGTYLSSTTADPVVVGMSAISGTPNYTHTHFRATDSSDPPQVITDWEFESGVDDLHTVDIYDALVKLYKLIHGP